MPQPDVAKIIPAQEVTEGAGVSVYRTIGTPALRNLDPFLLLDHFSSSDPTDYIAGFPDHPHRGFITLTYMLDGHLEHKDSMGNTGDIRAGAVQWMKAASGVIHSEMPQQIDGMMRGFQLWINLPASEKMSKPAYQEYPPQAIPEFVDAGIKARVLLGQFQGIQGPIKDPITRVEYFDIALDPKASFTHTLENGKQAFVFLFEGNVVLGSTVLPRHSLSVLNDGDSVAVTAGEEGARFIFVAGLPLGEAIVQYGPFVMNTQQEIHQAMADYRDGRLVQDPAEFITKFDS